MRGFRTFCILVALVLGTVAAPAASAAPTTTSVLVTLSPAAGPPQAEAARLARQHGAQVTYVYEHALQGFAAEVPAARLEALGRSRSVLRVEEDGPVTIASEEVQPDATWGLDRIDQRQLPLEDGYSYARTGAGVKAYILDTGIRATHDDFGGRVEEGFDAFSDEGDGTTDCHGHGTHVAGTVGSATWGVAKGVTLVPVRVLDCSGSGSWSGVAAGLDWIVGKQGSGTARAVANLSLSGGTNDTVDDAVRRAVGAGVTVSVAAGNGNRIGRAVNACNVSPARVAEALTVSATSGSDTKPTWANTGSCVDLFAPGVSITSTDANGSWSTKSGTSMAAPHVAGVAALLLSDGWLPPTQVGGDIVDGATANVVSSAGSGSPNLLLYSRIGVNQSGGTAPPPEQNQPPTASFTYECEELVCSFTDESADPDGTVVAWDWRFDDGATATAQHPTHTYAAAGAYQVTLTVTDDGGATGSSTRTVTVEVADDGGGGGGEDPEGVVLGATGYKVRGLQKADLSWSGAGAGSIDVYRDGGLIATIGNSGAYTDHIDNRGGGSYTYVVCQAGTSTCSNAVTVSF
jgi:serine protease